MTIAMLALAIAGLARAESPLPVYYRLALDTAMFSVGDPRVQRELVLDLEQVGERWGVVYGVSRDYNMVFHKGAVREPQYSGGNVQMRIAMDINPDKSVPGGQGEYKLAFQRDPAANRVSGTFEGTFNGKAVSGRITGLYYAPKLPAEFVKLAPQEHPRLLFRKGDLDKLREKAKTPFGQVALKKLETLGTPAAFGLLYQLTGDRKWADKALAEAELYLAAQKPSWNGFVPMAQSWGRLEQLALVYDLCYDALPSEFKARVRAWHANLAYQVYFTPEGLKANWHVVSNHVGNVFSGLLLCMLTWFDEAAPAPVEPPAPFLDETLPPARDFKPAADVPVVELKPGVSPTEWLHTAPLRHVTPDDPREQFYGLEKLNPTPGTKIKVGDFELTLDKMDEALRSTNAIGGLAVGPLIKGFGEPFTMVLYTVLEVKEPGQYVVGNASSRANFVQVSLAGQLLAHEQVVKLEKGYYPLMCMLQWRIRWGHIAPSLRLATPEDVTKWQGLAEQRRQKHKDAVAAFPLTKANHERNGGGGPAFNQIMRLTRFTSSMHCADAVGKGGFQAEVGHYSEDAMSGHGPLWTSYRRVMGFDLTPDNEYPDAVPRYVIGGPQDINGTTRQHPEFFAGLFPCLREEWKPDLLTAWHNAAKVEAKARDDDPNIVLDFDPVRTFVNYPLDLKPAPVGTKLPLVWEAPGLGYYAFRSGWGPDAFIAQVFLKSQFIGGWNGQNAGTYRLLGLGHAWACGTEDRFRGRQQESVVWMPAAGLEDGGCGRKTFFEAKDQTLVLSVNLDEVYERAGRFRYTKYGHLRVPSLTKDRKEIGPSGITGMRSIAFDYSKLSGAECLYAVADRITGGAETNPFWLYQPPSLQAVKPTPRGFDIVQGKASLQGVFACPAVAEVDTKPFAFNYSDLNGAPAKATVNAMRVPGSDNFFFVGTITAGEQPEIKVEGSGLNAVVTVGKRKISFDGQKLVLAKQGE